LEPELKVLRPNLEKLIERNQRQIRRNLLVIEALVDAVRHPNARLGNRNAFLQHVPSLVELASHWGHELIQRFPPF
jgi:hypothetical protein